MWSCTALTFKPQKANVHRTKSAKHRKTTPTFCHELFFYFFMVFKSIRYTVHKVKNIYNYFFRAFFMVSIAQLDDINYQLFLTTFCLPSILLRLKTQKTHYRFWPAIVFSPISTYSLIAFPMRSIVSSFSLCAM